MERHSGAATSGHRDDRLLSPTSCRRAEDLGHAYRRFLVLSWLAGTGAHHVRRLAVPLSDAPDTYGFLDGPAVLAGLNAAAPHDPQQRPTNSGKTHPNYRIGGITLAGDPADPRTFLLPDNEREWHYWRGDYRTRGQPNDIRLIPLYEGRDEMYTVYFSVVGSVPA